MISLYPSGLSLTVSNALLAFEYIYIYIYLPFTLPITVDSTVVREVLHRSLHRAQTCEDETISLSQDGYLESPLVLLSLFDFISHPIKRTSTSITPGGIPHLRLEGLAQRHSCTD